MRSVAFSPDGKYAVSASWNTANVWEISTGKEIAYMTYDYGAIVSRVAFSPDGKYVVSGGCDQLAINCTQGSARVWEASTGKEVARMTHDARVNSLAFSPDGKYVISGSFDYTARVWEASTGKEIARMTHEDGVYSVAFSPDGRYALSESTDNRVWIYLPDDLIADACSRVTRNLTRAEWLQYIGDLLSYQAVCSNLPIEPEITITPTP